MRGLSEIAAEQPRAVAALQAGLSHGRLHHAVLLLGASSSARRELALALGQALCCPQGGDGCGSCPSCRQLAAHSHPDVAWLAADGRGAIGIDVVRAATARMALRPQAATAHLVLVDGAEALTPAAQNALLKALEEPAGAAHVVLTAPGPRSVLTTVRSRCLRLQLTPAPPAAAAARLTAGGVAAALAPLLAWRYGDDVAAALPLAAGLAAVWARLGDRAAQDLAASEIAQAAAELGGDAERFDTALVLLELGVRDTLAQGHGAAPTQLLGAPLAAGVAAAAAAVPLLRQARRQRAVNASRPLALEAVLLTLAGLAAPAPANSPSRP